MKEALAILTAITMLLLFIFGSHHADQTQSFESWKIQYNKEFSPEEQIYRKGVYLANLAKINQHNSKVGKTYTEGINQFAALTHDEFVSTYLSSYTPPQQAIQQIEHEESSQVNGPTVDWVSYGAVSPVKAQGSCGATYAFSAVGAIEGYSVIVFKAQQQFSVQQVVDCSQSYGNNGCNTGRMDNTFKYVRDKGINLWASYPWTGSLGSCRVSSGFFKVKTYYTVKDCTTLANALTGRPVSVAVDGQNFQFYQSGIFSNCNTNLSLAVLLVGMTDYFWNLKNSWGTNWGENGYIRISRGNTCGVCMDASYPN